MKDKKNIIVSYILSKGLFFGLGISYILDNLEFLVDMSYRINKDGKFIEYSIKNDYLLNIPCL